MSLPDATESPPFTPIITLTIRWLPLAPTESPQQQKIILGVTLTDQEGTTTAPLLQMTTAAELGELPSALLVQLVEKAAVTLPSQLALLQSTKPQSSSASKQASTSKGKIVQTATTESRNNSAVADSKEQLKLFQS